MSSGSLSKGLFAFALVALGLGMLSGSNAMGLQSRLLSESISEGEGGAISASSRAKRLAVWAKLIWGEGVGCEEQTSECRGDGWDAGGFVTIAVGSRRKVLHGVNGATGARVMFVSTQALLSVVSSAVLGARLAG